MEALSRLVAAHQVAEASLHQELRVRPRQKAGHSHRQMLLEGNQSGTLKGSGQERAAEYHGIHAVMDQDIVVREAIGMKTESPVQIKDAGGRMVLQSRTRPMSLNDLEIR